MLRRLIKLFRRLRRKHFPTAREQWEAGWDYAEETCLTMGFDKAADYLWSVMPRDYSNPFDRGITDYIRNNQRLPSDYYNGTELER